MKEENSNYVILLGGTGARCGEIFLHMCANGYFAEGKVTILYIDSDRENGNAKSMKETLEIYQKCRERYVVNGRPLSGFFKNEVLYMEEDPVKGITYFKDLAALNQPNRESSNSVEALMKALYSEEEYNLKISEGFFARPNVGAALFAANMDQMMERLLANIRIDRQEMKNVKVFIIGSIFGGTGASSLATIAGYLKKKLFGESTDKMIGDKLKIAGCMILPYFSFLRNRLDKQEDEPEIEAERFATKTKAALEYYKTLEKTKHIFDAMFILGHGGHDVRGKYKTAGIEQRNLPHIVEFYAAMAAVAFFEKNQYQSGKYFAVIPENKIKFLDAYEQNRCVLSFVVMMRFSMFMQSVVLEELFRRKEGRNWNLKKQATQIPWYYDFLNGRAKSSDMDREKLCEYFWDISDYTEKYIKWFAELMLANIEKRNIADQVELKIREKTRTKIGDDEENDLVDYLEFFDGELLFRQYTNLMMDAEKIKDYSQEKRDSLYKENIKYIRKKLNRLSELSLIDEEKLNVKTEHIWTRLNSFGYNSASKEENVFKNIRYSNEKTMIEGVRNLINAIYIACMV